MLKSIESDPYDRPVKIRDFEQSSSSYTSRLIFRIIELVIDRSFESFV